MPATKPAREVEFEVLDRDAARGKARPADDPFIAFMARLMDDLFVIPGTGIRFGLDPIISLLPAFGIYGFRDCRIVLIGLKRRGLPKNRSRAHGSQCADQCRLISVPVGDVISIFYRSNARNYALLQKHAGTGRASTRGDWIFLIGLLAAVLLVIGLMIAGTVAVAIRN